MQLRHTISTLACTRCLLSVASGRGVSNSTQGRVQFAVGISTLFRRGRGHGIVPAGIITDIFTIVNTGGVVVVVVDR